MDRLSIAKRSVLMAKIGSKNTKPEMFLRMLLWNAGYRYKLHVKSLQGKPDIVFKSREKVIFIHGCFWHGHDCQNNLKPKSRKDYWDIKLQGNKIRDQENLAKLHALGWATLTIWECELMSDDLLRRMANFLATDFGIFTSKLNHHKS